MTLKVATSQTEVTDNDQAWQNNRLAIHYAHTANNWLFSLAENDLINDQGPSSAKMA
jgi:hypothetical protein